jgi:hypothetical protein
MLQDKLHQRVWNFLKIIFFHCKEQAYVRVLTVVFHSIFSQSIL